MACGCAKDKADACQNCVYGTRSGPTSWVDCSYWTERVGTTPRMMAGQYVRYHNGSVRTKEGSKCENFSKVAVRAEVAGV